MVLLLARNPDRLEAKNPRIVEDLLDLIEQRQGEAVSAIIAMLADLNQHGTESRFVRALKGMPILELKTAARGGAKGGARVYFFYADDGAVIVNCEVKTGDQASMVKLREALKVYRAHSEGIAVV